MIINRPEDYFISSVKTYNHIYLLTPYSNSSRQAKDVRKRNFIAAENRHVNFLPPTEESCAYKWPSIETIGSSENVLWHSKIRTLSIF